MTALVGEEGTQAPFARAELVEREAFGVEDVGAGGVEGGT